MVVVLNSYEAIYDAMVRHSEAFADRNSLFTEEKVMNPELRGQFIRCYQHPRISTLRNLYSGS